MRIKSLICLLVLLVAPLTSVAEEMQLNVQSSVSTKEEKELQRLENLNKFLLEQKAVGSSSCTTRCTDALFGCAIGFFIGPLVFISYLSIWPAAGAGCLVFGALGAYLSAD